jgi:NADH-quinone oxidoreductase subunit K
VIVIAAAEAAVALAIVINIYKNFQSVNVSEVDKLRD